MRLCPLVLLISASIAAQSVAVKSPAPPTSEAVDRPPLKPEEACSVEGKVVNAATKEPLKKATVTLRLAGPMQGGPGQVNAYTSTTDASGKFSMVNLEPGSYLAIAARTGFIQMSYGSKSQQRAGGMVTLTAGQKMTGIDFELAPQGVITGRIVDEDGEPMVFAMVSAMRSQYIQGKKQLLPLRSTQSDDRGQYRLSGLTPGRYLLSTTYRNMQQIGVDRSETEEAYLQTFYPGGTDVQLATPLEVAAGSEMQGVDLTLKKVRTARIRGRLVNYTNGDNQVRLVPSDSPLIIGMSTAAATGPKKQFEFRGVAPGAYTLQVMTMEAGKFYTAQQRIEVGTRNLDDVILEIAPGMELSGEVHLEDAPEVKLASIRVTLQPTSTGLLSGPAVGRVDAEGRFALSNISSGHYTYLITGAPPNTYTKSFRVGEEDALENGIDLTRGAAGPLRVVLSGKAGQATGTVTGSDDKPLAGATVAMVPDKLSWRTRSVFYKYANTNQYGQFTLQGITPGEYKIYAWDDVEVGAWMDPEFVKPFENKGQAVTVRESSSENVTLKAIAGDGK